MLLRPILEPVKWMSGVIIKATETRAMSNLFRNSALAGLALGLTLGGAAYALDPPGGQLQPPPADSTLTGVTVSVPKVVETTRYGVVSSIATISVRVPYGDLDMKSAAGIAELDRRVDEAGKYVCRQLDILYPVGTPEEFYCAREAVRGAQAQVIKARAEG